MALLDTQSARVHLLDCSDGTRNLAVVAPVGAIGKLEKKPVAKFAVSAVRGGIPIEVAEGYANETLLRSDAANAPTCALAS